jgi:hypothetical protein
MRFAEDQLVKIKNIAQSFEVRFKREADYLSKGRKN